MIKKILSIGILSCVILITYKNFSNTASTAQSQLFQEIFNLLIHNKIDEATQRVRELENLASLRGQSDETLLHRAAELGNPNLIEMIVKKGIHVDTQDKHKQTPLIYAIRVHNVPNVKKLLELDAYPFIKGIDNETALDTAKHYKNRFQMMGPQHIDFLRTNVGANITQEFDMIIELLEQSK